jgi:hypothetical protein
MFENASDDIDYYIYFYKISILNKSFDDYLTKKITYDEYYDIHNKTYLELIKLHNVLLNV